MKRSVTLGAAILFLIAFFFTVYTFKGEPGAKTNNEPLILIDLIIVRPASLAVVAASAATYLPAALVIHTLGGDAEAFKKAWLTENFRYTFDRPLGDFSWKSEKEERQ